MRRSPISSKRANAALALAAAMTVSGCMVGPNYKTPPAPVAETYQDTGSDAVKRESADVATWWTVFNDPVMDTLVQTAHRQNPTLQSAAVRVLEAQARRGIAVGLLFPQDQAGLGGGWELRSDRIQLDEKIRAQMRQRTNWGKLLAPDAIKTGQTVAPATTRPAE